ncbi:TPA: methylmalonyl-CoA mutase [Candidatus Bathyarchaeota archaeon]|nr:methylmalonyl-CoA mutase [Candidatus Bathyarchaeota archaeon]
MSEGEIKVLIAKPGLDGHDRGAKLVASILREAGMEVIYTGRHKTPEEIVSLALQEKVDLIGLSILSGTHLHWALETLKHLKEAGSSIPIVIGGIIPKKDIPILKEMGVAEIFPTGTKLKTIVDSIGEIARKAKRRKTYGRVE